MEYNISAVKGGASLCREFGVEVVGYYTAKLGFLVEEVEEKHVLSRILLIKQIVLYISNI